MISDRINYAPSCKSVVGLLRPKTAAGTDDDGGGGGARRRRAFTVPLVSNASLTFQKECILYNSCIHAYTLYNTHNPKIYFIIFFLINIYQKTNIRAPAQKSNVSSVTYVGRRKRYSFRIKTRSVTRSLAIHETV